MNKEKKMKKILICILTLILTLSCVAIVACNGDDNPHTHSFVEKVIADNYKHLDATCTQKASYYFVCKCGEKGTETFEHGEILSCDNQILQSKEPTCEEPGLTEGRTACSYCGGGAIMQEVIPATGHNYVDGLCACGEKEFSEGLEFQLSQSETYYIVKNIGDCGDSKIKIPLTYNNLPITSIGDNAFSGCNTITSITIPEGITSIGDDAFKDCTLLEKVFYKGNIEKWSNVEFASVYSNPMYYAQQLYIDNTEVREIQIPFTITRIKDYTFCGFNKLVNLTIPDVILSIGSCAFGYCDSLKNVTIPSSVTSIGENAFKDCTLLTNVYYNGSLEQWCNTEFASIYSNPMCYAQSFYVYNLEVKDIEIPNEITEIKNYTFCGFEKATRVTIPSSVTKIGESSFKNCSSLSKIILGENVGAIGNDAFNNCEKLSIIYNESQLILEKGSSNYGHIAYNANEIYTISEESETYKSGNFILKIEGNEVVLIEYIRNLSNITIPEQVTIINDGVFSNNLTLTSVTIGLNVKMIKQRAFAGCKNIKTINYSGTKAQWNKTSKGVAWNSGMHNYTVHCSDGKIQVVQTQIY